MLDSFEKLADVIKENNLCGQALDYLADIKIENEKLEKALELACKKLEDNDSILFDLYDRLDTYHPTSDRYEWKKYLLERVEEDEE